MPRATRVLTAAERKDAPVLDTLILPHAQRQAQKGFLFGTKGTCVELDFTEPVRLRTDDALVLDDGGLVEVVAEPEPLPADSPLWKLPNVVISPHIGGQSPEGLDRAWRLAKENVRRFVAGEPLLCVVTASTPSRE